MNRLMLCAGQFKREGWKTLDCKPGHDFVATLPHIPKEVSRIQWDEIEWVHGITSLHPWDGASVLEELRRCINEDGGKLVLEQPDFTKAQSRVEWLFGDPLLKDADHMNKWAYTPESLTELLYRTGFSRVDILPAQHHLPSRDFRAEAYR